MGFRIAIFGQGAFGREVTERLADGGHEIVGVYVPPTGARPDALATLAREREWALFRHRRLRRAGRAIPELVAEYRALGAELNVLPFTTTILPDEIAHGPRHGSICFHPSLLPAYRGGAALSWQILLGAAESGVTVFKLSDRIDCGPIVIQRGGVSIGPEETMGSLYFGSLYRLGVEAMVDAVQAISDGSAVYTPQDEAAASAQGLVDEDVARIDWTRSAAETERLIRACDPAPGARTNLDGEELRLFGASYQNGASARSETPPGTLLGVWGGALEVAAPDGVVRVERVQRGGGRKVGVEESGLTPGLQFV